MLVFIVATVVLGLAWPLVSSGFFRGLAVPVAGVLDTVNEPVVGVETSPTRVDLVLENGKRRDMVRALRVTSKLAYAVLAALVLTGFFFEPARSRLRGRRGIVRVAGVCLGFTLAHAVIAGLTVSYVVALETRGRAPSGLRVAMTFADVMQNFVPFLLFILVFVRAPLPGPRVILSPAGGQNAPSKEPRDLP